MLKLINSDSYDTFGPALSIVDIHSRGVDRAWISNRGLVKSAGLFEKEFAELRPIHGRSFLHLIAMGAMDRYGDNKNGDAFPKTACTIEAPHPEDCPGGKGERFMKFSCGLMERHPTFVKYGKVYAHHDNKDPEKASGLVHASAWNPFMDRVELLINVDNNKWEPELQKLASGEDQPVSMSCKVPYDKCGWCSHLARNRSEYCDHLKSAMTLITKEGHQIGCINEKPTFFDISKVWRPADRIASAFRKVASANMFSSELADLAGLMEPWDIIVEDLPERMRKRAEHIAKLSAIEKRIDGELQGKGDHGYKRLAKAIPQDGQLKDEDVKTLRSNDLNKTLGQLSSQGICLGPEDFTKLIMGEDDKSLMPSIHKLLPHLFTDILDNGHGREVAGDSSYVPSKGDTDPAVKKTAEKLNPSYSLHSGPAMHRIVIIQSVRPLAEAEKSSAVIDPRAQVLAREYAKYQLNFSLAMNDAGVDNLTILQNRA